MRSILSYIAVFLLLIGAYFVYSMFNKSHTDVANTEELISVSANELFDLFNTDEAKATTQYAEKVIGVKGEIYSKEFENAKEPQIVLKTNDMSGYIRCGFKAEELSKLEMIDESKEVEIKGLCKGFNASEELDLLADKDVVLSNCILIE